MANSKKEKGSGGRQQVVYGNKEENIEDRNRR